MAFSSLGLSDGILRAIAEHGYQRPTPIQLQTIPAVLKGQDLIAAAQTGTGKTAGFTLPMLERLSASTPPTRTRGRPRALVLAPTRELAAQVADSVAVYGRHLPLRSAAIFGGVNINPQIQKLRRGVDVLVATPGRLLDHVGQRTVDLSGIEILVLDEADRMLDMGFIPDIRRLMALLPAGRQILMFSATFSDPIRKLARGILQDPVVVEVAARNTSVAEIDQYAYTVPKGDKRALLAHLIRESGGQQMLVFTRTKHGADRLTRQLSQDGIAAIAIHGNKSQSARTKALSEFKRGAARVLIATDIAARGLDIAQLPYVINFELPDAAQDYVHRIGRTGRAGSLGTAVSLVCPEERKLLSDIERLVKHKLTIRATPVFPRAAVITAPDVVRVRAGGHADSSRAPRTAPVRQHNNNSRRGITATNGRGKQRVRRVAI
ncbi:MAG: DEAD/DEAH box helicase [Gammaproteobacteria bacterium]|nr:DEAD/DEAH box helicase [Gammaproteobacteria bacterium]